MFTLYVLRSELTGKRYVGSTSNVASRLEQHNRGKVRATKGGRPWKLVYVEQFNTDRAARRREVSLKGGQGRAELDRILCRGGSAPWAHPPWAGNPSSSAIESENPAARLL
ncbi:GIY-YIG nuclease family protein [Acidobacteriia bacterium AH_259_A11_L15]|nr:GIY-YIG nuclease family protein [Acidobacteriia bacterium AH_259_A11_L15]